MAKTALPQSTLERFPDHVKAIGMISIEIGNLEMVLGDLLAALLMIPSFLGQAVYMTPRAAIARVDVLDNVIAITLIKGSQGRKILSPSQAEPKR